MLITRTEDSDVQKKKAKTNEKLDFEQKFKNLSKNSRDIYNIANGCINRTNKSTYLLNTCGFDSAVFIYVMALYMHTEFFFFKNLWDKENSFSHIPPPKLVRIALTVTNENSNVELSHAAF